MVVSNQDVRIRASAKPWMTINSFTIPSAVQTSSSCLYRSPNLTRSMRGRALVTPVRKSSTGHSALLDSVILGPVTVQFHAVQFPPYDLRILTTALKALMRLKTSSLIRCKLSFASWDGKLRIVREFPVGGPIRHRSPQLRKQIRLPLEEHGGHGVVVPHFFLAR